MTYRARRTASFLLLLALVGCQREPTSGAPAGKGQADNGFTVEIAFSPAARERLAERRESVIVSAEYFGYPGPQAQARRIPGSENPWFTLRRAQVELDTVRPDGVAIERFPAVVLDPKELALTQAPDAPRLNLNVWSGRRSSQDNLLDCGTFEDTLAVTSRAPVRLSCRLIGEPESRG